MARCKLHRRFPKRSDVSIFTNVLNAARALTSDIKTAFALAAAQHETTRDRNGRRAALDPVN